MITCAESLRLSNAGYVFVVPPASTRGEQLSAALSL